MISPPPGRSASSRAATLDAAVAELLRVAHRHGEQTLRELVVRELLALVAAELAARVAVPAVAATGQLGTAPLPVPVALGLALAAGLLTDAAVVRLWDHGLDPHGRLSRATADRLDAVHRLVRDGTDGTPGLRPALERLAEDHDAARRRAVRPLLEPGGAP